MNASRRSRVVIADDDSELLKILARRIRTLGFQVDEASDGLSASLGLFLNSDPNHPPEFVILDVNMPVEDGLSICEELRREEHLADVPVIVLTGRSDRATIQRCRELGVHYVCKTGDVWQKLEREIRRLGQADDASADLGAKGSGAVDQASGNPKPPAARPADVRAESPAGKATQLLLVDDDRQLNKAIEKRLGALGFSIKSAVSCSEGYRMALKERPDAIITDYVLPDAYGSYLVRRLREHPLTKDIPIIVLTGCDLGGRQCGRADFALERQFFNIGANCVLRKPFNQKDLVAELNRQVRIPQPAAIPALTS